MMSFDQIMLDWSQMQNYRDFSIAKDNLLLKLRELVRKTKTDDTFLLKILFPINNNVVNGLYAFNNIEETKNLFKEHYANYSELYFKNVENIEGLIGEEKEKVK